MKLPCIREDLTNICSLLCVNCQIDREGAHEQAADTSPSKPQETMPPKTPLPASVQVTEENWAHQSPAPASPKYPSTPAPFEPVLCQEQESLMGQPEQVTEENLIHLSPAPASPNILPPTLQPKVHIPAPSEPVLCQELDISMG